MHDDAQDALDADVARDLDGVEVALARLDAGTYWTCQATGEPLTDELLAADPTIRRLPRVIASRTVRRAAAGGVAVTSVAAAAVLADPARRTGCCGARPSWWLGVGRARDLATHRAARSPKEQRAELDTRFAIRSAEDTAAAMGEMKARS